MELVKTKYLNDYIRDLNKAKDSYKNASNLFQSINYELDCDEDFHLELSSIKKYIRLLETNFRSYNKSYIQILKNYSKLSIVEKEIAPKINIEKVYTDLSVKIQKLIYDANRLLEKNAKEI